jgi:hypothetical protein
MIRLRLRPVPHSLLLGLCLVVSVGRAADGDITASGLIVDPSGKGVRGAVVMARKMPAGDVSPTSPFRFARSPADVDHSSLATTGQAGNFVLNRLFSARYSICVQFPDHSFLNTCRWSGDYVRDMGKSTERVGIRIVVQPAAAVRIDIWDPQRLLPIGDINFGTGVVVGVLSSGNDFYTATLVRQDVNRQHYVIEVPVEQMVRLWVFSRRVKLLDASGRELDRDGASLPLNARAHAAPPAFTLHAVRP